MEIEEGKKSATFEKIMQILKAYRANMQEFLWETGYFWGGVSPIPPGTWRRIPRISWAAAGTWLEKADSFQPQDAEDWVNSSAKGEKVFALPIKDNSMEPDFCKGDGIVIDPNRKPGSGHFVIATSSDNKATFRQYVISGKTTVLHPLNPKYKDIVLHEGDGYRIVGVMVESSRKYK
jgi:SOS-response transcriptional repressor LexA